MSESQGESARFGVGDFVRAARDMYGGDNGGDDFARCGDQLVIRVVVAHAQNKYCVNNLTTNSSELFWVSDDWLYPWPPAKPVERMPRERRPDVT